MKTKTNEKTTSVSETPVVTGGSSTGVDANPPKTSSSTDLTQLTAENEQLKATIRLSEAHRQITGELAMAGARSPELLFDSVKDDLQFAADGSTANAAALIERLKRGFPEQFGVERPISSIDAGAGITAAPQLTREALAKMKPSEIAELDWADVRRVLANG